MLPAVGPMGLTIAAVLLLTGCGSGEPQSAAVTVTATEEVTVSVSAAPEEVTVTETVTPAPVEVTVTETATEEAAREDDEPILDADLEHQIAITALEITWDEMSFSDQDDVCFGWLMDEDMVIEAFLDTDMGLTRSDIRDFFDEKCS